MSVDILRQKLASGEPVLSDGAFGEVARARGVATEFPLWATHALLSEHGRIVTSAIHSDYLQAGAHIITTGTFRAQQETFAAHHSLHGPLDWEGLQHPAAQSRRAILLAAELAIDARNRATDPESRLVAASYGPLRDCYTPGATPSKTWRDIEHTAHAERLAASGVDFLAIETIPTIREGVAAAQAAERAGIAYGISFWGKNGGIGVDETFQDATRAIEAARLSPLYIGANCMGLEVADRALANLRQATDLPIAISANGEGDVTLPDSWDYNNHHDDHYAAAAERWLHAGAVLIGGCCGTTPKTIQAVAALIGE